MDWIVRRRYRDGKVISNHLLGATAVRGRITVGDEFDEARRRMLKVARVLPQPAQPEIPPLMEVQIAVSSGGNWSLSGFERGTSGVGNEVLYGQAWTLEPAPDEDLIRAEREVSRMASLLVQHGLDPKAHPG